MQTSFDAESIGLRNTVCPIAGQTEADGLVQPLRTILCIFILGVLGVSLAHQPVAAAFPMVASGRAAPLLVARDAAAEVRVAIDDFTHFVNASTGVTPAVEQVRRAVDPRDTTAYGIAIGEAAGLSVTEQEVGFDGYRIVVTDRLIRLTGSTPAGTANALYDLLESALGVRFLVPGEDGAVVPKLRSVTVQHTDRRERPVYAHRNPWFNNNVVADYSQATRQELDEFVRRNRGTGVRVSIGHYYAAMFPPDEHFALHPEYYAEVQGRRIAHGQLCTSNADVVRLSAEHWIQRFAREPDLRLGSLTPNDGGLHCTGAVCSAQSPSIGERLILYMNEVTEAVTAQHPDRLLTFYAYGALTEPVQTPLHPRLVPSITRYVVCQAHALDHPSCPSNVAFRARMDGWRRNARQFFVREFACWWRAPDLAWNVLADNLRAYARQGAIGVSREYLNRTFGSDLMRYVDIRLMWDPEQDPDQLVDNFMSGRFGSAGVGVREIANRFRQRLEAVPPHQMVRASEIEIDLVYDIGMLEAAVDDLEALAERAPGVYGNRVRLEADLLRASLEFRRVTDSKNRYAVTGSEGDLEALEQRMDTAARHFGTLESRGALSSSFTTDLERLRHRITGPGLTEPLRGGFDYVDDLAHGGFTRRDAELIDGFYPGQYGLSLLPGRRGSVTYALTAAPGMQFDRVELTRLVFNGSRTRIEIETGDRRQVFAQDEVFNDTELTYDLSGLLGGTQSFLLTFSAENNGGRPALCLDSWGIRGETSPAMNRTSN